MLHRVLSNSLREATCRRVEVLSTNGAVSSTVAPVANDGFTTMTSAGSGVYTVTLQRGAPTLVEFYVTCKQASYSVDGACYGDLTTDNVAAATPTITFTMRDADGVAVQPATGDKLFIKAVVKL